MGAPLIKTFATLIILLFTTVRLAFRWATKLKDQMNLVEIDRLEMMRKRQAYFSAIAEEYTSFADFIQAQDMWLAIMGIELTDCELYLKLYIQLDFSEYEEYYVIPDDDGQLTVSDIAMWNNNEGCTSYINLSIGKSTEKEMISEV